MNADGSDWSGIDDTLDAYKYNKFETVLRGDLSTLVEPQECEQCSMLVHCTSLGVPCSESASGCLSHSAWGSIVRFSLLEC